MKYTIEGENIETMTTHEAVEVALWAGRVAPCILRIEGEGIPNVNGGPGCAVQVAAGEQWDNVLDRVNRLVGFFTSKQDPG